MLNTFYLGKSHPAKPTVPQNFASRQIPAAIAPAELITPLQVPRQSLQVLPRLLQVLRRSLQVLRWSLQVPRWSLQVPRWSLQVHRG